MTIQIGPNMSPVAAASAPRAPQNLEPTQTDMLITFGPGMIWHTPKIALNSSELNILDFSTRPRRAQGKTPPKPDKPILLKQIKS
jgi:hypothetical protein